MKRSPLKRSTPLRSSSSLRRVSPLRSGTTAQRRAHPAGSGRARPDEPLADWCEARIEGVCTGRAAHRHHIRRRSQGGTDDASNTTDICSDCHQHVHANPAWSYANGLLERGVA